MSVNSKSRTRSYAPGNGQQQKSSHHRTALDSASNGNGTVSTSREREKTQSVNIAFTMLRTLIPTEPVDRKLSKIETLRLASSYISHLSSQLNSDQPCVPDPGCQFSNCFNESIDLENGSDQSSACGDAGDYSGSTKTCHETEMAGAAIASLKGNHQNKICTFCLSESKKLKSQMHSAAAPCIFESSPYQYQLLTNSTTTEGPVDMMTGTVRSTHHQGNGSGNGNGGHCQYYWSEASNIL